MIPTTHRSFFLECVLVGQWAKKFDHLANRAGDCGPQLMGTPKLPLSNPSGGGGLLKWGSKSLKSFVTQPSSQGGLPPENRLAEGPGGGH